MSVAYIYRPILVLVENESVEGIEFSLKNSCMRRLPLYAFYDPALHPTNKFVDSDDEEQVLGFET